MLSKGILFNPSGLANDITGCKTYTPRAGITGMNSVRITQPIEVKSFMEDDDLSGTFEEFMSELHVYEERGKGKKEI